MRIVVPVRCCEIPTQSCVGGILAEYWVCSAEGAAGATDFRIDPTGVGATLCAETIEAEAAGSAAGEAEVRGTL